MIVLNKTNRAIRVGVYEIDFHFSTKNSNIYETLYLNIDKPERIISVEKFLYDEVVETYFEGYPKENIQKINITEKPVIDKITFRSEFFYTKS